MSPDTSPPGRTALVVDDSRVARLVAKKALASLGYLLLEAGDGATALALLDGGGPVDLVLIDRNMPDMDGPTLIRELRRKSGDRTPRLLLASAAEQAEGEREAAAAGADGFLAKPWSAAALAELAG